MDENQRRSDIVDEAFQELRQTPLPEGPDSQALEQTLRAVHQAQQRPHRVSLVERIRHMNKFIKYPVAAAIVLAVLAGGAYIFQGRNASVAGIAFADVRQQIEEAQTMTMTASSEMKVMEKTMPVKMKMYFKSPGLMRQEMTMGMAGSPSATTTGGAATPPALTVVTIADIPNQKGISLVPGAKKAIVIDFKNVPDEAFAKTKEKNFLEKLKDAVKGTHEELGEKTIDGRKAKGYRCKTEANSTMDIWVDPSTGKPIQTEQDLPDKMGKFTMTDFVLNPKLDDSLFDTAVPEGYTVEKQTVDFNATEQDLIKGLGLLAKYCGGVFPKALMPTLELIQQLEKAKPSPEESKEFGMCLSKLIAFRVVMAQQGEFVYAGEGVKLGAKETPILWYKGKDAKKYRVIYGDLHAEDAEKAPPRPVALPATEPK
jgi:outer membrane lipoprotein-sorting protein